jgi:hypothetical protein
MGWGDVRYCFAMAILVLILILIIILPHIFVHLDQTCCLSMATAAKFVQQIPIFFTYLVPLDVDVVFIKFYQFLFGK